MPLILTHMPLKSRGTDVPSYRTVYSSFQNSPLPLGDENTKKHDVMDEAREGDSV
jgi:hypothetical protein